MSEPSVSRPTRWRPRMRRLHTRVRGTVPFAGGIVAALVALLLYQRLVPSPRPLTTREVNASVAQALASATVPPASSARVYQAIRPSFVLIQTQTQVSGTLQRGVGSGVVVDSDGDVLTSLHVVADASEIQLTFADGAQSVARVMARQPENDIAVVRASQPPPRLVPATLGNPKAMRIGDEAFVVGNPLGLYGSMSAGVISGLDRTFTPADGQQKLQGLMQIDAAVNPGSSGGPLLNRDGQVVGIITGLENPTEQSFFVGIGFAVPIDVAGTAAGLPPY